jgi:CHAD domain-containing protein
MLLEVENNLGQLPTLAPFCLYLQQREQQLLVLANAYIKNQSAATLHLKLRKARHRCQRLLKSSDLPAEITRVINGLNINVSDRQQEVDVDDLDSIHHLRIAVKKLRYTLTVTQSLLPEYPPAQLQALLDYLTLMGDIQNSAVLSHALQQYYSQGVPTDIQQYFQQRQQKLLVGFTHLQAKALD